MDAPRWVASAVPIRDGGQPPSRTTQPRPPPAKTAYPQPEPPDTSPATRPEPPTQQHSTDHHRHWPQNPNPNHSTPAITSKNRKPGLDPPGTSHRQERPPTPARTTRPPCASHHQHQRPQTRPGPPDASHRQERPRTPPGPPNASRHQQNRKQPTRTTRRHPPPKPQTPGPDRPAPAINNKDRKTPTRTVRRQPTLAKAANLRPGPLGVGWSLDRWLIGRSHVRHLAAARRARRRGRPASGCYPDTKTLGITSGPSCAADNSCVTSGRTCLSPAGCGGNFVRCRWLGRLLGCGAGGVGGVGGAGRPPGWPGRW